jgi:hypothetical protein
MYFGVLKAFNPRGYVFADKVVDQDGRALGQPVFCHIKEFSDEAWRTNQAAQDQLGGRTVSFELSDKGGRPAAANIEVLGVE